MFFKISNPYQVSTVKTLLFNNFKLRSAIMVLLHWISSKKSYKNQFIYFYIVS